jgi:hypothetical protein
LMEQKDYAAIEQGTKDVFAIINAIKK